MYLIKKGSFFRFNRKTDLSFGIIKKSYEVKTRGGFMDKNTKKALVGTGIGLGAGLYAASKFTRKVKNQSLSSLLVNNFLESLNMAEKTEIMATEKLDETIESLLWENRKLVHNPLMLQTRGHGEYLYEGMQVFTWNTSHDPEEDIIIYFHGGGYIFQPNTYHFIMGDIIAHRSDSRIIMPIYPKAPEYNFKDAFAKLLDLYKEILAYKDPGAKIHFMGDSAGGGLALAFNYFLIDQGLRQADHLVLISPWLDLTISNPHLGQDMKKEAFFGINGLNLAAKAWAGKKTSRKNKYVSPIWGDLNKLTSKITLFTGTQEFFFGEIEAFAQKLRESNIELIYERGQNQHHTYPLYPTYEGWQARNLIVSQMKRINKEA